MSPPPLRTENSTLPFSITLLRNTTLLPLPSCSQSTGVGFAHDKNVRSNSSTKFFRNEFWLKHCTPEQSDFLTHSSSLVLMLLDIKLSRLSQASWSVYDYVNLKSTTCMPFNNITGLHRMATIYGPSKAQWMEAMERYFIKARVSLYFDPHTTLSIEWFFPTIE